MSALETTLSDFTRSIAPPAEWRQRARETAQKVFDLVRSHSQFQIDRCCIVGGFEKNTSTAIKVDVDTGELSKEIRVKSRFYKLTGGNKHLFS